MASMVSMVQGGRFAYSARPSPSMERGGGGRSRSRSFATQFPISPAAARRRSAVVVRAETINPEIRKTEEKVVDSVPVADLAKPVTAYCRCWRSGTFPLCDGSHMKHNKATGDNVGPLLLKK